MSEPAFAEGVYAIYKDHYGYIKFISHQYITLCINSNPDPLRDVCILIYKSDWKDVKLVKESTK